MPAPAEGRSVPLLDHFHQPLAGRRHWEAFHARWTSALADALNDGLPDGYFAEPQVHPNARIEVDVATFAEGGGDTEEGGGGVATMPRTRATLAPADLVLPAAFPPVFGVRVFETSGGPTLVAAIELVSPANKDRTETRRAFAAKCAATVNAGCGLMVVDVVTSRTSRPLDDLLPLLAPEVPVPDHGPLSASAFRPVRTEAADTIEAWVRTLAVGQPLPELPLFLDAGRVVMVDLEAAYEDARSRLRL